MIDSVSDLFLRYSSIIFEDLQKCAVRGTRFESGTSRIPRKINLRNVQLERSVCVYACVRARARVCVIIWGLNYVSCLPVVSSLIYFTMLY